MASHSRPFVGGGGGDNHAMLKEKDTEKNSHQLCARSQTWGQLDGLLCSSSGLCIHFLSSRWLRVSLSFLPTAAGVGRTKLVINGLKERKRGREVKEEEQEGEERNNNREISKRRDR